MEGYFGVVRLNFTQRPINLFTFSSAPHRLCRLPGHFSLEYIASVGKRSDTSMHGSLGHGGVK